MNPAVLIFATLLFACVSTSSLTVENVLFDYRDDLKLFLDWTHEFSKAYEAQKIIHVYEFNKQKDLYMVASVETIDDALSSFISSATQLRNVLVKGNSGNAIRSQPEDNVKFLTTFIVNVSFVFDNLQKSIKGWEIAEQRLRKSLTVMDEKPLKWFKDHGFDESTLNDISIQKLKEEVNKLYGDGQPLDTLLSLFGTIFTFCPPGDVGSMLGWLAICGTNGSLLSYLERYLRETIMMKVDDVNGIIGGMVMLGNETGPLRRLFGNGTDDGLYPFIIPMLKRASYMETCTEKYMKMLLYILSNIFEDLKNLRKALKNGTHKASPMQFYREFGFIYDKDKLNTEADIITIKRLTGRYAIIPSLMKHAKQYVRI